MKKRFYQLRKQLITLSVAIVSTLLFSNQAFSQGVRISEASGNTPHGNAVLDLRNTSFKGFLVPQIAFANLPTPAAGAEGLLVYQTDNTPGFRYWDGSAWQTFGGGGSMPTAGKDLNYAPAGTLNIDATLNYVNTITSTDGGGTGVTSDLTILGPAFKDLILGAGGQEYGRLVNTTPGLFRFGIASTTTGTIQFANSGTANTVTIGPGATSGSYALTLPLAQGAANTALINDGTGTLTWTTPSSLMANLTEGTGVASFTYNGSSAQTVGFDYTATVAANPVLGAGQAIFGTTGIIYEGSVADGFEGLLTVANPTADRTWTLPNVNGTVALGTGTANYAAYWSGANIIAAEQFLATSRGGLGANMTAAGGGEIPYSTSTTAYGHLAAGTSGQSLLSGGTGAPTWGAPTISGVAALTNGKIWIGNGSNIATEQTMSGDVTITNAGVATIQDNAVDGTDISLSGEANGNVMTYNSGTGNWEAVSPSTLPVVTSFSAINTGLTPNAATTGAVILAGTLDVDNGGTGATTLTGMLKGNGTSPVTGITGTQWGATYWSNSSTIASTAAGTSTTVLHGNASGAPSWGAVTGADFGVQNANRIFAGPASGAAATPTFRQIVAADFNTTYSAGQVVSTDGSGNLSFIGVLSNPMTTIGDIIYASASGTPATPNRLGAGSNGNVLHITAGIPSWSAVNMAGGANEISGILPFGNGGTGYGTGTLPATGGILYTNAGQTAYSVLTGTNMQTIRYNGTVPTANNIILNDGTRVGIALSGTTTEMASSSAAKLIVDGTNVTTLSTEFRGGDDQNAITDAATYSTQLAFAWGGDDNGYYRHNIRTRHNSSSGTANAIDFYLWKPGTDAAGTLGTNRVFTIFNDGTNSGVELYGGVYASGSWGTAGQVLASGGTGVAPTWVAASTGTVNTAQNGIYISGGNIVRLGSNPLIEATTITQAGFGFDVKGGAIGLNDGSNFAVNIATGTSNGTVTIGGTGTQTIAIGNGAGIKTVNLGSNTTTSSTTLRSGTGGALSLNATAGAAVTNIGTGTTTGAVTIGGASNNILFPKLATAGGIIFTTAATGNIGTTANGAATTVLHGGAGGTPTFSQVNLAAGGDVTGILPIANGGTGSSTQGWVDLTTAQTAAGIKTWSSAANFSSTIAVTGVATFSNATAIRSSNGTAALPAFAFTSDPNTGIYNGGADILGFAANGAEKMRVTNLGVGVMGGLPTATNALVVTGKVKSTGINETSDARLKKNFASIDGALDKVMLMNGKYYDWRVTEFPDKGLEEGRQVGVIAQEIEKILPEVVVTDDDGYKSVEYGHIVPVLIEAIKEQQKIIDTQKSSIDVLKASLENVTNRLNIIENNADLNGSKVEK